MLLFEKVLKHHEPLDFFPFFTYRCNFSMSNNDEQKYLGFMIIQILACVFDIVLLFF